MVQLHHQEDILMLSGCHLFNSIQHPEMFRDCRHGTTFARKKVIKLRQTLWSSGRLLGSRSEGCGFDPHPMQDAIVVKAMLVPAHLP